MKKILVCAMLAVASIGFMNAQQVQNAIGVKQGITGADFSFQYALSDVNRLEANIGFGFHSNTLLVTSSSVWITGIYQWVWDFSQLAPGFQWYVGVGALCGIRTTNSTFFDTRTSGVYLAAIGNIGIEYNFEFPLQLAIDWTPGIGITTYRDGGLFLAAQRVGFAARWRF